MAWLVAWLVIALGSVGAVGAVGALGSLGSVGAVGAVGALGSLGSVGAVGTVGAAAGGRDAVGAAGVAEVRDTSDAAPWVWPTGTRVVTRPWEAPADDYAAGHRGLDVSAALDAGVVAVAEGTVSFAGQVAGRGVVTIDHGDGLRSTVDSVTPTIVTGDVVAQGDTIGRVAVGHCPASDPCLHLGARVGDRYVDPALYLAAAEWPVLLPDAAWPG